MPSNPFRRQEVKLKKLYHQYQQFGQVIVGVDFDFTLYDSSNNYFYKDVLKLTKKLTKSKACKVCLWTANNDIDTILEDCTAVGLTFDHVNESPLFPDSKARKPHFNVLLDDASGLDETMKLLEAFLAEVTKG